MFRDFVLPIATRAGHPYAVGILGLILVAASPTAADGVMLGTTGWSVDWTSAQVTNVRFLQDPGNTSRGTMIVTRTLDNFDPVNITFNQDAAPAANEFGLRITLEFDLMTNQTGSDIGGFILALIPNKPLAGANLNVDPSNPKADDPPYGKGKHPAPPHFHNDGYGFQGYFTLVSSDGHSSGDPAFTLGFGNGVLPTGERIEPNGIGIHEWSVGGYRRSFDFTTTPLPIPEPSSLMMGLTAVLIISAAAKRCRRPTAA